MIYLRRKTDKLLLFLYLFFDNYSGPCKFAGKQLPIFDTIHTDKREKAMKNKITIYDIAKTAGVSTASVSRMIHQPASVTENTRKKILSAFSYYNMAPEDLSTRRKTEGESARTHRDAQTVLISVPTMDNLFYNEVLYGIRDYLDNCQYHIVTSTEIPSDDTILDYLNWCDSLRISGIITMHPMAETTMRLLKAAYPLVQCSEYNPFYQSIPYVSVDDHAVSKIALAHLIRLGCKRIAFFSSSYEYRYVQNRYRAYKAILAQNNMPLRPEYVIQVSSFSYDKIFTAAKQYFSLPEPPDAVFAVSDKHANAVVRAGQETGFRIPDDVRVLGFDDTLYATLSTPAISTIAQPRRKLGIESARLIIDMIKNPDQKPQSLLLPTELILRDST